MFAPVPLRIAIALICCLILTLAGAAWAVDDDAAGTGRESESAAAGADSDADDSESGDDEGYETYVDDEDYGDEDDVEVYVDDEDYGDEDDYESYIDDEEDAEGHSDDDADEDDAAADDEDEDGYSLDEAKELGVDPTLIYEDPTDDPSDGPTRPDLKNVEQLTVTATKREESIQDVPISMSALDSNFLDDSGLTKFNQLQEYVPNLTINPVTDTRGTTIRIRGIGSVGNNSGIDPSVGVFIDGVYQGRAGMSTGDLLDIERVEVLRGPQGTLYGKNTAAGLINIISKRPNYDEISGVVENVIGNYDNYEQRFSVNVPIVDDYVATLISGYRVVRDGFDKRMNVDRSDPENPVIFKDDRVNDDDRWGVKGRFLFDLTDDFSFLVTGDFARTDTACCVSDIITPEGAPTLIAPLAFWNLSDRYNIPLPPEKPFNNIVNANVKPHNKVDVGGVSLDATYDIGEGIPVLGGSALNLIGAWRTYSSDSRFDGDFSYFDAVLAYTDTSLDQYSVELRMVSPGYDFSVHEIDSNLNWMSGFYFYHQKQDTTDALVLEQDWYNTVRLASERTENVGDNQHETWTYAGFGQATLTVAEQVSVTGGVRVTYEEKLREGTQTADPPSVIDAPPIFGPDIYLKQDRNVTNVSWLANLRYFPTDDVMLYASVATGFKSGGFNQLRTVAGVPGEFDDEESINYEAGFKTSWFENMLTFNVTGFYTDYDKFQAQIFDGSSINVVNAGSLESYGVEGEIVLVPLPGLIWGTSVGFNIARYTDFKNGVQTAEQKNEVTNGAPIFCGLVVPPEDCVQDLTGERLNNAPDWSVSSFIQYEYPLPRWPVTLFTRGEYSFTSTQYLDADLDRALKQNSYHIFNLRGGFRGDIDCLFMRGYEVTGWVRNLTDENYNVVGFDIPTLNGFAAINGPARQYGLTVRVEF